MSGQSGDVADVPVKKIECQDNRVTFNWPDAPVKELECQDNRVTFNWPGAPVNANLEQETDKAEVKTPIEEIRRIQREMGFDPEAFKRLIWTWASPSAPVSPAAEGGPGTWVPE